MIDQKTIDRINELARKSRTEEGLTGDEKEEQQRLRQEYVAAYRQSLRAALEHTTVVSPDGTKQKLSEMHKKRR